mgnify:CR=1 FL=1
MSAALVNDYRAALARAIAAARESGLGAEAEDLQRAASCAYTTSSELFAEQGAAILRFLKATRGRLPHRVKAELDTCLAEIGKTWSPARRLAVWLYRRVTV